MTPHQQIIPDDDAPVMDVVLPLPHFMIRMIRANTTYFVANRGGFKTTRGISFYLLDCVHEMPRSTGVIVGPSFEHLMDNTINPLFHAVSELGYESGADYVIGERPPPEFYTPLIPVEARKYDHIISFANGTNLYMISMAKKASANGISAQFGIFDEIKLMEEKQLNAITLPIFRGNEKHFSSSSLFMSKFYATDKLADPAHIEWILAKQNHNDQRRNDVIIALQSALTKLLSEYHDVGSRNRLYLRPQIAEIEKRLSKLRSGLSFYVESNHLDTMQILGPKWYKDKESNMKPYELKVAIRNENPDKPEDGFYPDFEVNTHTYKGLNDYDPIKPLIIAADYQHSISPIDVVQISRLPGASLPSVNYINEVYTRAPDGLEMAVQKFCDLYSHHVRRLVYYIYDQTATGKRNDALEYYKIVLNKLKQNKFVVVKVYTGATPAHFSKYSDIKKWLINEKKQTMDIRINREKCIKTIGSITRAPAKITRGKTEKDKSGEQNANLDQSLTTHYSDVFDMINHAIIGRGLINTTVGISGVAYR